MNKPTASYAPPGKDSPASIDDLISVKKSLAQVLADEAALMDKMQLQKVGELQERKLKLTALLERYMRYLQQNPEIVKRISAQEKAELMSASQVFNTAMKKNYDTLLVARAVNKTIVKCVTQTVARKDSNPTYNARGNTCQPYHTPVSITLNQTI